MDNRQIKVIFFGTPSFVVPILESLGKNFNLVGAVTAPDRPVGRSQILRPSPVKSSFRRQTIFTPQKLDEQLAKVLGELDPDLIVVASYGKIIPQSVLDIPRYGALNVHPSLLPKYRGASPIQATILNGDKVSGISIIRMDEQMDHGPLVYQEELCLSKGDTFESLSNFMFRQAGEILVKLIPKYIDGKVKLKEQNHRQATFCKILKRTDGYFDIGNPPPAEVLDRMIRAYFPWPGVWTKWNDQVIKFYPHKVVQMEGKKRAGLEDFLRGYPNFPIKSFL